jgi:hypothetical protein
MILKAGCVLATLGVLALTGCDKIGDPFADPAKTCVADTTFGKLLDITLGDNKLLNHLHRSFLAASASDAVLASYDKTTKLISCRGTLKIQDKEHEHDVSTPAAWTIQPTADAKALLYEIPGDSVAAINGSLFQLDLLATPVAPPEAPAPPPAPPSSDAPSSAAPSDLGPTFVTPADQPPT